MESSLVGGGWSIVGAKEPVEDVWLAVHDVWNREKMGKRKVVLVGVLHIGEFLMAIGRWDVLGILRDVVL